MDIKRSEDSWLRKLGFGGVAAGMLLAVTGVALTPASAAPGNNGTIKVDEQGLENGPGAPNSNDPHIDCAGRVEWYGFDEGVQSSDVTFEVQAPTSTTGAAGADTAKTYDDVPIVDGDGPGGTSLDGTLDFDLSDLLAAYEPHPKQGYHVMVTAHTTFAQGSDVKHKVFWVQPCEGEAIGGLTIEKAVDGNDLPAAGTEFGFTLDCTSEGQPVDLNGDDPGNTATFVLTAGGPAQELPLLRAGATCTITETDDQEADGTSWVVDGGDPTPGDTDSVEVTIGDATTVRVVATNTFDTAAATFGSLSIDKVVDDASDPQDPALTFLFDITCMDGGQAVDLNGAAAGTTATVEVTEADAAEVLSGIPTGATCTVTETEDRDADAVTMKVGDGNPTQGSSVSGIVIGNATTIAVLATNTFTAQGGGGATFGSLSLDKDVAGDGGPPDGLEFSFDIDCSNGLEQTVHLTADEAAHVIGNLPTGTTCTIVETDDGNADGTTWTGGTPIAGQNGVTVTIGNATTVAVTATNEFDLEVLPLPPITPPQVLPEVVTPPQVLPEVVTPERPVTRQQPTQVLGSTVTRPAQLPRTGDDALLLVQVGLGMVLLGAGALLFGRERPAAI